MRDFASWVVRRRYVWMQLAALFLLAAATPGCQADLNNWNKLTKSDVAGAQAANSSSELTPSAVAKSKATVPATPTATPVSNTAVPPVAPEPLGTPAKPKGELDAASKIIPIPKASLPKGPRKLPPNRLLIPSIGVDAKIIELGTHYNEESDLVWDTAPFSVGHHVGTANPGEQGNMVLSGHISSIHEGAVFKRLPEIEVGDGVIVGTNDRKYLYQIVDKKTVDPTQIDVMNSTLEEVLTMITCVPDGIYTHRLIVTARRI